MSRTYRQTISDELARLVDERRGVLSVQDFTTMALAKFCNAAPILSNASTPAPAAPSTPQPQPDSEMLGFD